MIDTRKNEYIPDYASPPGSTLLETLEMHNMSQAELATRLGMHKKTVHEIIKGKAPINPETATKLERVLGVPASFWNARQQQYEETLKQVKMKRPKNA